MKLDELRTANQTRALEWDTNVSMTALFHSNELAGEVGEACNVVKKLERERLGIVGSRAKVEDLAEELADIVIVADLLAAKFNIDLGIAIARKFNKTSKARGFRTMFPNVP